MINTFNRSYSKIICIAILIGLLISIVAINTASAKEVDKSKTEKEILEIRNNKQISPEKGKQINAPASIASIAGSSASSCCASYGGSTSYESISSVTYTQNPGGTMTITVDINIANPTGCSFGQPCPEYDQSPEYVNVWIDWNGNGQLESNEKVIDEALTGYSNINYHGTMMTSKIVTIPPNAVSPIWTRANLGWGHDPNDPCELYWTWGNVVDQEINIDIPDLEISSSDIIISKIGSNNYKTSVKIHNNGESEVSNVKVKFVRKYFDTVDDTKTVTIPGQISGNGGTTTASVEFIAVDLGNYKYEVTVDPDNEIDENDENNNYAETHKITGIIRNSAGNPLKHLKIEYQENIGGNWQTKYTTFTDSIGIYSGKYNIITNLDSLTENRDGRIRASLMYSPTDDEGDLVFRIIDENEWGNGENPSSTTPVSRDSATIPQIDKSQDYTRDITFTDDEGGLVYTTLVTCNGYFDGQGIAPAAETRVEINNDDKTTNYQSGNNIHFIPINLPDASANKLISSTGHEYTHLIEEGWMIDSAQNHIEEGSAHWGSSICRGNSIYISWNDVNIDLSDNDDTDGDGPASAGLEDQFQIAGTYWDLNANHVWSTLNDSQLQHFQSTRILFNLYE